MSTKGKFQRVTFARVADIYSRKNGETEINIAPRRVVEFTAVFCLRQFAAISGKAPVALRINEWLGFLKVPSGVARIHHR